MLEKKKTLYEREYKYNVIINGKILLPPAAWNKHTRCLEKTLIFKILKFLITNNFV